MNPEENTENRERPAAAEPAPATAQGQNAPPTQGGQAGPADDRNRRGPRPPRFRRGGRGRGRGDRGGDRGAPREGAREVREGDQPQRGNENQNRPRPGGTIGEAMEQVEAIRSDLTKVLQDIQEVMDILDQVEREKNASEDEIEALRDSLRSLHRDQGQGYQQRPQRNYPPQSSRSAPAPSQAPVAPEPTPELDAPGADED